MQFWFWQGFYAGWRRLFVQGPTWLVALVTMTCTILSIIATVSLLAFCVISVIDFSPASLLGLFTLWSLFVGSVVLVWALIQRDVDKHRREAQARQTQYQIAWQAWNAQRLAAERAHLEAAERFRREREEAERAHQEQAERAKWEQIARLNSINGLLALSPTEFELMVGKMLEFRGFVNVEHTGGAGDLAADLTCEDADGQRVVVQCKRYAPNNLVGSPEIQKFLGMMIIHHQADMGLFITTSGYTIPALALGDQHNGRLLLIGGDGIAAMMQEFAAKYEHKQSE